ncbi:MAG: Uroporphyrinogen III methylase [uncultured bacterium]|nr:MAG: Uroporphyrinogen III methylase [uncultured bacterium]
MSPVETNDTHPPKKINAARAAFWGNIGILFSGFALVVLIGAMILTVYSLLAVNRKLADDVLASENRITHLQENMLHFKQAFDEVKQRLDTEANTIANLQKAEHISKDILLAEEAESLVQAANDHLLVEANNVDAIRLLKAADERLSKLTDPNISSVRAALAADIVALQSATAVDVVGVYTRLVALNEEIDQLPLLSTWASPKENAVALNNQNVSWWREGLQNTWEALKHIVVVRRNEPNAPPFLTPDSQAFVLQNLHAMLLQAEWGLLHRQPDIYRTSLNEAASWIKRYAKDSPVTRQMIANLMQLAEVNVHPTVPLTTNTLHAFQVYFNSAS